MSSLLLNADLSRYHLFTDHSEHFSRRRGTTTNTPTIYSSRMQSVDSPSPPFPERLGGHHRVLCQISLIPLVSRFCPGDRLSWIYFLTVHPDRIQADVAFRFPLISTSKSNWPRCPFYSHSSRNLQTLSLKQRPNTLPEPPAFHITLFSRSFRSPFFERISTDKYPSARGAFDAG
jgi:hypothetical protein